MDAQGRAHRSTVRSRPLRVSENPQARQGLIRRKQAQRTPAANSETRLMEAYVIAFLVLAVPFLTSPIWGTMYGGLAAMRAIRAAFPKHQHGNGRRRGIVEARLAGWAQGTRHSLVVSCSSEILQVTLPTHGFLKESRRRN